MPATKKKPSKKPHVDSYLIAKAFKKGKGITAIMVMLNLPSTLVVEEAIRKELFKRPV